ncbi:MAG TPA: hypothetical protein VHB21_26770, partial [Minicystis sp.]|nr:hypothetical protein [Minicystis sp.]
MTTSPRAGVARRFALAAAGGALLFLADGPVALPYAALVAFAPLLAAIDRASTWREAAALGGVFAVLRFGPLAVALGAGAVPAAVLIGAGAFVVGRSSLFALAAFAVRRRSALLAALATGAAFAATEAADLALPFWGTATSLARDWALA